MDWRGDIADSQLVTPVLGIQHELMPKVGATAQFSYSEWDEDVNNEKNRLWKPEGHITWQTGESNTLMAGGEYRKNKFSRTAVDAPDQWAYALFFQDEWFINDYLSLMAAMRYDKVEDIESAISPKMSLLIETTAYMRVRLSVGRGFQAPTLQELYEQGYGHGGSAYRFGNPDLEPEYSTTYMVGIEITPMPLLTIEVNGFYSDLDDMIVPVYEGPWDEDPSIDVWRRINISNAIVWGAEGSVIAHLSEYLTLESGYTFTENEDKDTGRQLPYSPGSSAYGKLSFNGALSEKLNLRVYVGVSAGFNREAWNWKPTSEMAPDDPNGLTTKLDDYTKLDSGATLEIAKKIDVFLKIENILGEDIENLDDVYTVIDGEPYFRAGLNLRF